MKKLFVLILSLCMLVGCTSTATIMQSWVGSNMSDLIASWGPPTREMSDGKGGRILIYEYSRNFNSPGYSTTTVNSPMVYDSNSPYGRPIGQPTATTTYYPPTTSGYVATRCFWVDSNGIIYNCSWKGL